MSSMASLITVGITCFNSINTIARAIESAMQQDWDNLEIIVVDDCSDDGSVDIIRGMMRKDNRVRLVRHESNFADCEYGRRRRNICIRYGSTY